MDNPRQNALQRLGKKSISAKDIANQFWCEKQMELYYLNGQKQSYVMKQGSAIHAKMQDEVFEPLKVEPSTWPDRLYKSAYENVLTLKNLLKGGLGREFKIYGALNGFGIAGQIDELRIKDGKVIVVENKTTTAGRDLNPEYTRPHIVQVMLYRKLLEEIKSKAYTFQNFNAYYKVAGMSLSESFTFGLKTIGLKDEFMSLDGIYNKMFNEVVLLPPLSEDLIIHYLDRETNGSITELGIKYDSGAINKDIIYAMKYWTGERDAAPVIESEKWKCKLCRFYGKECKTWWTG